MFSTISAKLLLVVGVAILLTGQMSYCDNGEKVVSNKNGTKNSPPKSDAVEVAKKIAEPVKPVVEEKEPAPVKNGAAIPVAPAAVVAPVPAIDDVNVNNKYARQNLLKNQTEIPGTIQTAFYVFVAFGLVVIFYISYRSYRLRSSRAARRYGTRGNHSRHELQPLPSAIELESEDEENTVFDRINNKN